IAQIDAPQRVFETGLARGAAISVGIIAITLASDLFATPDYYPSVLARLVLLRNRILTEVANAEPGFRVTAAASAALLREITDLRPDISALAIESSKGRARSRAACNVMVGLASLLADIRALGRLQTDLPTPLDEGSASTNGAALHAPQISDATLAE